MLKGCCSSISPCAHQRRSPDTLCDECMIANGDMIQQPERPHFLERFSIAELATISWVIVALVGLGIYWIAS